MPGDYPTIPKDADPAGDGLSRTVLREQELGDLLAAADVFLSRSGISARVARHTRLVVEELVTNAFRHGGAANAGGVSVDLRILAEAARGSVSYTGPAFDPTAPSAGAGDDKSRIGGQGLTLIRSFSGDLSYARQGEINRVEFAVSACEGG